VIQNANLIGGIPKNFDCHAVEAHIQILEIPDIAVALSFYSLSLNLHGETRMTRRSWVTLLTVITGLAGAGALAQQTPGIIEVENAAAGDVHYEISTTNAAKPYANVDPGAQVKLGIIGSKPGAAPIVQNLEGMSDWAETRNFPAVYGTNIGYPCRITLDTTSDDGWHPASVEVKYFYLNELQSTALFSNKGEGLGWIDNKGCGQDISQNFNLALRGSAQQSTTSHGGAAARVIDGNTDGIHANGSVSHTDNRAGSWWQVTLDKPALIGVIVLWNRTDCCMERLTNFRVSVMDQNDKQEWTSVWDKDLWQDAPGNIDTSSTGTYKDGFLVGLPEGTFGRRVKIEFLKDGRHDNYLSLAEVQVFGTYDSGQSAAKACPKRPVYFADTLEEACKPNSPLRNTVAATTSTGSVSVTPYEDDNARLVSLDVSGTIQNGDGQQAQISHRFYVKNMNGQYQELAVNPGFVQSGIRTEQSRVVAVTSKSQLLQERMTIPYGAFQNLQSQREPYELAVTTSVRIGGVELQSERAEFRIVVY